MAGPVFGNSFDSVMRADQVERQMQAQAGETAFGRLLQMLQQKQINKQRQAEFQARQEMAERDNAMRLMAMEQDRAARAEAIDFRNRELAANIEDRNARRALDDIRIAMEQEKFNWMKDHGTAADTNAQQRDEERLAAEALARQGAAGLADALNQRATLEAAHSSLPTPNELAAIEQKHDTWMPFEFWGPARKALDEVRPRYAAVLPWNVPYDVGSMSLPDLQQAAVSAKQAEMKALEEAIQGANPDARDYLRREPDGRWSVTGGTSAATASKPVGPFASEVDARSAGYKNGDEVVLVINGRPTRVRLR